MKFLFYHAPMASPLGSELPLGCSRGLPLATWRFPLPWFWSAEDRIVLGSISLQSGFPLFVVGHFFLLDMGLGLDMKWARVPIFFGPTPIITPFPMSFFFFYYSLFRYTQSYYMSLPHIFLQFIFVLRKDNRWLFLNLREWKCVHHKS